MNKLKNWLINSRNFLTEMSLQHGEYILLATAILLFLVSPFLLRCYDPTAGTFDVGVLQVNITSIISLFIFCSVSWLMLKVIWPDLRHFFENEFGAAFTSLTSWQKVITSLFIYCFIVLVLVMLNQAIPAIQSSAIK